MNITSALDKFYHAFVHTIMNAHTPQNARKNKLQNRSTHFLLVTITGFSSYYGIYIYAGIIIFYVGIGDINILGCY